MSAVPRRDPGGVQGAPDAARPASAAYLAPPDVLRRVLAQWLGWFRGDPEADPEGADAPTDDWCP